MNDLQLEDEHKQIAGLRERAYTLEGRNERLTAELKVRIKPTTIARLNLFCQSNAYGYPLIDQVVDEALHDYLVSMGH